MRIEDFNFDLPPELIAQYPRARRTDSRLLVVRRSWVPGGTPRMEHRRFRDLPGFLRRGDILVLNRTRVFKARLVGHTRGGGRVEVLLVREKAPGVWEVMAKPARKFRPGAELWFGSGEMTGGVTGYLGRGRRELTFSITDRDEFWSVISRIGSVPLPPYVRRPPEKVDERRYQTVFAREPGAVAAPTAGLHFTRGILQKLESMGVELHYLVLHVGPGTFRPILEDDPAEHRMEAEYFSVPAETALAVSRARGEGRRVIAVGTTCVRALESASLLWREKGVVEPCAGWTELFIYPPFDFQVVDGLITNFHLPRSSLILLVSAFLGRENTLAAYREAIARRYRFFSYGDAMLIL